MRVHTFKTSKIKIIRLLHANYLFNQVRRCVDEYLMSYSEDERGDLGDLFLIICLCFVEGNKQL